MSRIVAIGCLFLALAGGAMAQSAGPPAVARQEIRFQSGRFEIVGDLLTPQRPGPNPVIIYVWGAGPTNRKAHIERSKVLKVFLEKGFAVFLYDKPGSGGSTGEFDNSRLFEESAAVLVDAIGILQKHVAVDPKAIGLYGSSQASYVMAVALGRTTSVAFVIAWSCPMESSVEQSAYLVRNYVLCDGGSPEEAEASERAYLQRGRARSYTEYREAALYLESVPSIRDGLGWAGVASEEDFSPADSTSASFLDPRVTFSSLTIPILAVYAENDRQVDPVQGAEAFRRLFAQRGRELSEVAIVPGADHNMNLSPRGCMQDQKDDYRSVGGRTISPVFLETVAAWLDRLSDRLERTRR